MEIKSKIETIEDGTANNRELYRIQRYRLNKKIKILEVGPNMIEKDEGKITKHISEHFSNKFRKRQINGIENFLEQEREQIEEEAIKESEIFQILSKNREETSPGTDGFSWHFYIKYKEKLSAFLAKVFNQLLQEQELPINFRITNLKLID